MGDPIQRYPSPEITFGIEYEFDFVVLKALHHAFDPCSGEYSSENESGSGGSTPASGSGLSRADAEYGDGHGYGATDVGIVDGDGVVVISEAALGGNVGLDCARNGERDRDRRDRNERERGSLEALREYRGDEGAMGGIVYTEHRDPGNDVGSSSHQSGEDDTGWAGNENENKNEIDERPESRYYTLPQHYTGYGQDPEDDPLWSSRRSSGNAALDRWNEVIYSDNPGPSDENFDGYSYDDMQDYDDDDHDSAEIKSIPSTHDFNPDDLQSKETLLRKAKRKAKRDSSDSSTGAPSEKTTSTRLTEEHYQSINQYVAHLLNHTLPHSPKTPSLIAPVHWAPLDKEASADTWSVTQDGSVEPRRRAFALFQDLEAAEAAGVKGSGRSERAELRRGDRLEREVRKMWRVSGVELVSAVLRYNDDWMPKLQQIHNDLSAPNERAFFPPNATSGLHVHVAINGGPDVDLDSAVGFACMQNVVALYGLFEDEIERWLPVRRRDEIFTSRIRLGMEMKTAQQEFEPTEAFLPNFTPQLFTQLVYEAKDPVGLRRVTTGEGDGAGSYVTVNISAKRDNKPTTIEFRHHHGTTDPVAVKWWVEFLVYLVKYSYLLAQFKYQIRDPVAFPSASQDTDTHSFVQDYASQTSILDFLSFPEAGKAHFAQCAATHRDRVHDAYRALDRWFIGERCREMRRTGCATGMGFDRMLRVERGSGYREEVERVQGVCGVRGLSQLADCRGVVGELRGFGDGDDEEGGFRAEWVGEDEDKGDADEGFGAEELDGEI